ncbi:MAG: ADP-forming succinate--CoA ligase subunit beta [Gammaproteobacteria bacterium]|nr:ADP-forming succinate--CoA ligase subunit beta [Gammaproteobacteria bacterium]
MNLHEYQAKQLFAQYGVAVSQGIAVDTADEAVDAARKIGGERWMVKAQVHAGGRGKGGGIKLVDSLEDVRKFAASLEGRNLVTYQTDANGQPVSKIYVEVPADIERELYFGAVIDRSARRVVFMASNEGGVDIESVARDAPEKILRAVIDPFLGAQPYQGRELAFGLGLDGQRVGEFAKLFISLSKLFHECDCSLLEVNPLVVTSAGDLLCLDAKVNVDGNSLYRQPALEALYDPTQEDPREVEAATFNLSYVALDGTIGCMVNGAGLAMGTMDLVKLIGGSPANFLDVGGGATQEAVTEAFKIILSDSNVKAVLINIFGGIVSCAVIADGIIGAVKDVGVEVPVVVRFEGNNAEVGRRKLRESALSLIAAESLADAAEKAVLAARDAS